MNKQPDVLTDVFDQLRLNGVFVSEWKVTNPWAIHGSQESCALLHYIVEGSALVTMADQAPIRVESGDLIIFPRGESHTIGDSPTTKVQILESLLPERNIERFSAIAIGGGGEAGQMLCAGLHFKPDSARSLYQLLPSMLVITAAQIKSEPLLAHTLDGLTSEINTYSEGRNIVLVRGFELVYVLGLRVALRNTGLLGKFSAALQHRGIGRALLAMHNTYTQQWSVDSLAKHAGLSRTAFVKMFKEIVDETPRQYLIGLRLIESRLLLSTTTLSLSAIADKVGYESPVGLHLAFVRLYGMTPGAFRKHHRKGTLSS